jgi:hypothetical protein
MEYALYNIVCKDVNVKEIYVGSTKDFGNRKREHKTRCNDVICSIELYRFIKILRGIYELDDGNGRILCM